MSDSSVGEDYEPYIIGSRLSNNKMTSNPAENPTQSKLAQAIQKKGRKV